MTPMAGNEQIIKQFMDDLLAVLKTCEKGKENFFSSGITQLSKILKNYSDNPVLSKHQFASDSEFKAKFKADFAKIDPHYKKVIQDALTNHKLSLLFEEDKKGDIEGATTGRKPKRG